MIIILLFLIILFVSITFHEAAHAWVASRLGDPTPKEAGRLSLNPLTHIDVFGTIALPIILSLIPGVLPFGYAKPVPINPYHFKNPKKDIMWVSLAGPGANLAIATFLALLVHAFHVKIVSEVLLQAVIINLVLAVFNLIPIPPLDGSKILTAFLPHIVSHNYMRMQIYGFALIIILVNLGFFRWFIMPVIRMILNLLGLGYIT